MPSIYLPFLCAGGLLVVGIPLFCLAWLLAMKKGWASIRLLIVLLLVAYAAVGTGLWVALHETWIIWSTALMALLTSAYMMSMPRTNPKLMKSLRIKW